jgi:hypothetical protein
LVEDVDGVVEVEAFSGPVAGDGVGCDGRVGG